MPELSREILLRCLDEWGHYATTFRSLSVEEQTDFLKTQGYASLRDLLAHVAVWWEEARGIVANTIKHGQGAARKYDFAAFNAAAVKRFKETPEHEFLAWYEAERMSMLRLVQGMTEAQLKVSRVRNWLNGVLLEHLKEHGVNAPRFLIVDMLQREWGDYLGQIKQLTAEKRAAFVEKQGYKRPQDLAAHVIAWWEQGIAVIEGSSSDDPWEIEDVDAFNARAVERFGGLDEAQVWTQFENTRLTLCSLVDMLPEEVLGKPNVRSWLRADVINHYYEHQV